MKFVLKADRLIDGSATEVVKNAAVVVEDETITKVCSQSELNSVDLDSAHIIDHSGGTLMPGFIEMHSHIHCSAESDAYEHITTETNETGGGFTPGTNVRAPQYDWNTLKDAVEDAERLGLKVAAHCHATEGVKNCVKAGIHNLIHCSWMSENPDELYDYDPDVADQIAEKGIYVDPTLALSHLNNLRGRVKRADSGAMADPERRFEILRDMWDRGVKFVTGMDSGMTNAHFDDFAYIPEVMVNSMGISPMEAITCATKTSAECLGKENEIGTITPGKSADILIVNGDPSEKIEALHNVDTIVSRGSLVKELGQLLI